ncbi:hypothetical protein GR254_03535, partial [Mycobacterium tuberculosis]|nr:hypothetical protein [Mycobacterium tuberculosis]
MPARSRPASSGCARVCPGWASWRSAVTDSDGNTIDTSEFFGKRVSAGEAEEAEPADE